VKRPGVQVRARHGYRALSADEMRTTTSASPALAPAPDAIARAISRLSSTTARAPVLTRAAAWPAEASANGTSTSIWITGELGADLRANPAWRSGARARLMLVGANSATTASATAELAGTPPAFSIRMPEIAGLTAGNYSLRVALSNSTTGETLTDSVAVTVPSTPSAMGEALLFRRGQAASAQPVPTADSRFRRSERIHLELPTASKTAASARVLDAVGKPINVPATVSTRADASGTFDWVVVELTLAPFAPADYALEVKQGEATQVVGFRVVN
jgi:hypothetical protein